MGILEILRGKQLPPGDPATQKAGTKLINKNADPAVRLQAAETLREIGTEEAIYCLLQRFIFVFGTNMPDEDEKKAVFKLIESLGEKSIRPIIKFIKKNNEVAQALQLLKNLSEPDMSVDHLMEIIESFDPYYSKFPDKKIQTFRTLSNFKSDRVVDALKPFLDDDDDDVRIAAIEAIASQEDKENIRELLLKVIIESEEQPRIRIKACDVIAQNQWKVKGYRKQIASALPDRFYMDKKGRLHLKGGLNI